MPFQPGPAEAPGTLITRARDKRDTLLTSVVRKGEVTLLDIVSTRMLGQFGFLSSVFQACAPPRCALYFFKKTARGTSLAPVSLSSN